MMNDTSGAVRGLLLLGLVWPVAAMSAPVVPVHAELSPVQQVLARQASLSGAALTPATSDTRKAVQVPHDAQGVPVHRTTMPAADVPLPVGLPYVHGFLP